MRKTVLVSGLAVLIAACLGLWSSPSHSASKGRAAAAPAGKSTGVATEQRRGSEFSQNHLDFRLNRATVAKYGRKTKPRIPQDRPHSESDRTISNSIAGEEFILIFCMMRIAAAATADVPFWSSLIPNRRLQCSDPYPRWLWTFAAAAFLLAPDAWAGKRKHGKTSPNLSSLGAVGKHYKNVTIEMRKTTSPSSPRESGNTGGARKVR